MINYFYSALVASSQIIYIFLMSKFSKNIIFKEKTLSLKTLVKKMKNVLKYYFFEMEFSKN